MKAEGWLSGSITAARDRFADSQVEQRGFMGPNAPVSASVRRSFVDYADLSYLLRSLEDFVGL
jgi:hypothetical protein